MNVHKNSAVKLFPVWKELYDQAKAWEYGSFHSHDEVAAILQHRGPLSVKYYGAVRRAGRELEDVGQKCLANVPGKGYRVIHPREHKSEGARRFGQATRRIKRAYVVVRHTDESQLTEAERRQHADSLSRIGTALALAGSTHKAVRRIAAGLPVNRDVPRLKHGNGE